jgi:7-cyano-7-deazaguanine synthase
VKTALKAIALVSGGMDSLVTLAAARVDYEVSAFHAQYGQLTEERELRAFTEIADHYTISERLVSRITTLHQVGGSSLTDRSIPVSAADPDAPDIPSSYVPFRNAHFLSSAVSWGEIIGATALFIGAVTEDSSGYPDCRREFYDAFEQLIDIGTRPETNIRIITPVIHMKKKDVILKGLDLGAPFHLTWSCYRNSKKACGNCDSCELRLRAFREAGSTDQIEYE